MSKGESINAELSPLSSLKGYFGKKFDLVTEKSVSDLIVKASAGLFLGTVASLTFMKRRVYPAVIGTSFGFGSALGNCYKDLNELQSAEDSTKHEENAVEANDAQI